MIKDYKAWIMKDDTKLIAKARPYARPHHAVNPPVERASTLLFPTYEDFLEGGKNISYGRLGTSTHRALEEAITDLECGYATHLAPSGYQACVASILAFVSAGDHILMTDAAYDPSRKFCDRFLNRFDVGATFYDPLITEESLTKLITPSTKLIFAESPGSLTFETQDLPMLARVAKEYNLILIVDNTWSSGYYCKPLRLGADVSIQAATKYIVGHADCLVGSITSASKEIASKIFYSSLALGANVSADDAYLALRGLRTLGARLQKHQENGFALAHWLSDRAEVNEILHPAFPSCPGHEYWKRDFTGASGLFGVVLNPVPDQKLRGFFDALTLFGMGFSWGGFESLCIHVKPEKNRTATPWTNPNTVLRFHAGLEDVDDLTADLDNAFKALSE